MGSWRRLAIAVSVLGSALGWAALPGCARPRGKSPPLPPACGGGVCPGLDLSRVSRLTDLPEEVVRGDFRLSPPVVKDLTAEKASDGGTLLRVRFAPDRRLTRTLPLVGDKATITLRDDGSGGDDRPDDGSYAATLPVPFAQIRDGQAKLAEFLRKRQITDMPIFEGRAEIGRRSLRPAASAVEQIPIFPVGSTAQLLHPSRTLLVTDPGVIGDPARTFNACTNPGTGTGTPGGVWTFSHLMTEMANHAATGLDPEAMARAWFSLWISAIGNPDQPASMLWPSNVDLAHAPFQLIAIVNRPDLATNLSGYHSASLGKGGELRFVFELCSTINDASLDTVIIEYGVPAQTCTEIARWARDWIALNTLTPGTAAYDAALETLTEAVVRHDAAPSKSNGSALNQIRTDARLQGGGSENWVLHEWHIEGPDQGPTLATVAQTPLGNFNDTADLGSWINLEQDAILAGTDIVGDFFTPIDSSRPFIGRSAGSNITTFHGVTTESHWNAPGILSNAAREKFSLGTCNGCHTGETNTHFRHLGLNLTPSPSGFLTGIDVPDPVVPSTIYHFDDLARRAVSLTELAFSFCLDQPLTGLTVMSPPFDPGIVELGPVLPPLPPITFRPTITSD